MSNFSKALEVSKNTVPFGGDFELRDHWTNFHNSTEYRVTCKFGTSFLISDDLRIKYPHCVEESVKASKMRLIHHVFGEFREPLYQIRKAVMKGNSGEAMQLLGDLEDQMFKI